MRSKNGCGFKAIMRSIRPARRLRDLMLREGSGARQHAGCCSKKEEDIRRARISEIAPVMEFRVRKIVAEMPEVKTFVLQPTDRPKFDYRAGQFLTFIHGHQRRSYSLSSAPGVDELPAITVKRVPNGWMSRYLIDYLATGDVLLTSGAASGIFTLPEGAGDDRALWLFAAGIGITPVFSLLKAALYHTARKVVLVYSNQSPEQTVFYQELLLLQSAFGKRLSVCWLWSNARDLRRARLSRDSFSFILAEYLRQPVSSVLCYTCGPPRYMWLVQLLLQEAGVPATAIRREVFSFEKNIPRSQPPDLAAHRVQLNGQVFIAKYPDTILTAARKAGINLPYSCEAGQCGSCTMRCTAGTVWMSYNEVLTEADLAAGRVLSCTGYPAGGDIILQAV